MSNPTNFGINGSNCVVAFLGVWIVSSGGFLWEDFGRQPSVVVWGSEAALEGIEERGAGFEAALCCLADEIFFVNDGKQGSSLGSCVKCAFFWASWGGGFLWRHTLLGVGARRALFFCCFPPKEKPTRAGSRRTPRHKDNNKNKTAGNLNDSLHYWTIGTEWKMPKFGTKGLKWFIHV